MRKHSIWFDGMKRLITGALAGSARQPKDTSKQLGLEYEFCPRCEANLTLQKGYSSEVLYWNCKGCGEMLINPSLSEDVVWICDKCEAMLNTQTGFSEGCGEWVCTNCGYSNRIDSSQIYLSENEYQEHKKIPTMVCQIKMY